MQINPSPTPHNSDDAPRNWLDVAIVRLGNVLSLMFIATALISFYEVVMRYAFNAPTIWCMKPPPSSAEPCLSSVASTPLPPISMFA